MPTTSPTERIYFAPFELDLANGRLLRGLDPVNLQPKAFGVLRHMAERPGKLVSKKELLQTVWPDVNVHESVLKVQIAEIRKALSDPCREPRYIQTAHCLGYRFIAPTGRPDPPLETQAVPITHYARSGDLNIAYEHLSSVRDLERSIASLPPEFRRVTPPGEDFDMKD
jgi:DNA-binding winged helix-turn-helix (wHTH) protein